MLPTATMVPGPRSTKLHAATKVPAHCVGGASIAAKRGRPAASRAFGLPRLHGIGRGRGSVRRGAVALWVGRAPLCARFARPRCPPRRAASPPWLRGGRWSRAPSRPPSSGLFARATPNDGAVRSPVLLHAPGPGSACRVGGSGGLGLRSRGPVGVGAASGLLVVPLPCLCAGLAGPRSWGGAHRSWPPFGGPQARPSGPCLPFPFTPSAHRPASRAHPAAHRRR